MATTPPDIIDARENIAQTVAHLVQRFGETIQIAPPDDYPPLAPILFSVPEGRKIIDQTEAWRKHAEYTKPFARKGTARLTDLVSLIGWANRFKGDTSALYASLDASSGPAISCIADYHAGGATTINPTGDPAARHCQHRAIYNFPLSKQWNAWKKVSGQPMSGIEMGIFLEDNILDVIDPPLQLTRPGIAGAEATPADHRLIDIARRLEGSYGSTMQLLGMAKSFTVDEAANYTVAHNSTTGEATVQIKSEHMDKDGQPVKVPKLFLIAIPVFERGHTYRLPVRFQYRKAGSTVKFILTLHDPKAAIEDAFNEATTRCADETGLPLFLGTPET